MASPFDEALPTPEEIQPPQGQDDSAWCEVVAEVEEEKEKDTACDPAAKQPEAGLTIKPSPSADDFVIIDSEASRAKDLVKLLQSDVAALQEDLTSAKVEDEQLRSKCNLLQSKLLKAMDNAHACEDMVFRQQTKNSQLAQELASLRTINAGQQNLIKELQAQNERLIRDKAETHKKMSALYAELQEAKANQQPIAVRLANALDSSASQTNPPVHGKQPPSYEVHLARATGSRSGSEDSNTGVPAPQRRRSGSPPPRPVDATPPRLAHDDDCREPKLSSPFDVCRSPPPNGGAKPKSEDLYQLLREHEEALNWMVEEWTASREELKKLLDDPVIAQRRAANYRLWYVRESSPDTQLPSTAPRLVQKVMSNHQPAPVRPMQ